VRIQVGEVELARDQEDNGANSFEFAIATRLAFGSLEQAVDGFKETVCLTCPSPGNDAFHVISDHVRNVLHVSDLGAHDIVAPLFEHLAHHVDLLPIEYLAQLLLIHPSAGRTFGRNILEKLIQVCLVFLLKIVTTLK